MFDAILRGLTRIVILAGLGLLNLWLSDTEAMALGAIATPVMFGFGLCLLGLAAGDLALRILQPHIDTQEVAERALRGSTPAAIVYLGRCILAGVILFLMVTASRAAEPPGAAKVYLPTLHIAQEQYWPAMPYPAVLGAQVEQETCISLTSRSCWNPHAELHTSREQGVGLGQLTRTFRSNGAVAMDALADIRQSFPKDLAGLSWENRYDPALQLRALVMKDRQNFKLIQDVELPLERLAMTMAAYNGGLGGLNSDRKSCAGTPGCDPAVWFGNVEHTSLKAKAAVRGYGKSFFEINREYVVNVMQIRVKRYAVLGAWRG